MPDAGKILARIRHHGANIMLDGSKLVIVNRGKLPDGALDYIRAHGKEIAAALETEGDFNERAAIIEFDGGLNRAAAEYLTRLLMASVPEGYMAVDWQGFVDQAARLVDGAELRRAA